MSASFRGEPVERRTAVTNVIVNVDQSRRNVKPVYIDHFLCLGRGNIFAQGGDFAAGNRNVEHRVNIVSGIDDMSAFQQKVISWSLRSQLQAAHKEDNRNQRKEQ